MKAILLAAGLGTRLRPLTDSTPKCLVEVGSRPLLEYWLRLLVSHGINDILINTHHHADQVSAFVHGSQWAKCVTLSHEPELLGTGGSVLANREFLDGAPFLVAHADNLAIFDPRRFAEVHAAQASQAAMTMLTFNTDSPSSCGIIERDANGIVQCFHEKVADPPGTLASAATYIMSSEVLGFMAGLGRREIDLSTEVIPAFIGRIATFDGGLYLRDIGTPASLTQANRDVALLRTLI